MTKSINSRPGWPRSAKSWPGSRPGVGAGVARPEQVAGKTGLEMMQAMLRGEMPYAPIARTLDFR